MMSRTHGQPATPTTLEQEMANVAYRLQRAGPIAAVELLGKINGAVGNYNAHLAAYPEYDWEGFANVSSIPGAGLQSLHHPDRTHDALAELFDAFARANSVLIDLDRDIWGYISLGFFKQKVKAGEIGSSTMPTRSIPSISKIPRATSAWPTPSSSTSPRKLPISRWQRDHRFDGAAQHGARPGLRACWPTTRSCAA